MTDNQLREMFDKLTKCVNGIQVLREDITELKSDVSVIKSDIVEIKSDVSGLKSDVSELKAGQTRIEKSLEITNRTLDTIAGDSLRVKSRVEILEERIN